MVNDSAPSSDVGGGARPCRHPSVPTDRGSLDQQPSQKLMYTQHNPRDTRPVRYRPQTSTADYGPTSTRPTAGAPTDGQA